VASKSAQHEPEKAEVIEELLDHCDTTLDRVKVLYEQFFLGIQKQPPTHIHTDVERKLRELQQMQIRNTALRYRFATIQQKFGSYNNYWRRTLRQIESGTYHRNLAKIGRQAAQTGEDIPDEILAAMPKRMREQVKRDREAALAMKRRREGTPEDGEFLEELDTATAAIPKKTSTGAHILDDGDGEFDLDAYFRAVTNDDQPDETKPGIPTFPSESPAPRAPVPARAAPPAPARAAPPARAAAPVASHTPEFEGELPTESDFDPPTERPVPIINRPAPITNSPIQHASAAVRAAVGMRTPPAGLPRVVPPGLNHASGGFPPISTQPGHASGKHPAAQSGVLPAVPLPPGHAPPGHPPGQTGNAPPGQSGMNRPGLAPSQVSRPLPVMPGASSTRAPVAVETLSGPFPREQQTQTPTPARPTGQNPAARTAPGMGPQRPAPGHAPPGQAPPGHAPPGHASSVRPAAPPVAPGHAPPVRPGTPPVAPPAPSRAGPPPPPGARPPAINPARIRTEPGVAAPTRVGPPPGMTDADVNALYAKYVKAKEAVGEKAGPGSYGKLLQTINAQAPKIMEQYKAKGVDFQVVVKDNQVVIRAKPKP
jgi:hypothetical protein